MTSIRITSGQKIANERRAETRDRLESDEQVREEESFEIVLLVCKAFSGEIVRASVRSDRTIDQLIPEIADQIGYFSPNWEKIGLYNLTRDFEYSPDQVLAETRTRSGDLVIMADGAGCHKTE